MSSVPISEESRAKVGRIFGFSAGSNSKALRVLHGRNGDLIHPPQYVRAALSACGIGGVIAGLALMLYPNAECGLPGRVTGALVVGLGVTCSQASFGHFDHIRNTVRSNLVTSAAISLVSLTHGMQVGLTEHQKMATVSAMLGALGWGWCNTILGRLEADKEKEHASP